MVGVASCFYQAFAANHGQVIDYPRSNKELIIAQNNADINQIAKLIKIKPKAKKRMLDKKSIPMIIFRH